jgi:hypothetical protein
MSDKRGPLVVFRLENEREAEKLRALARRKTSGNVSAFIRDALRSQHAELAKAAEKGRGR